MHSLPVKNMQIILFVWLTYPSDAKSWVNIAPWTRGPPNARADRCPRPRLRNAFVVQWNPNKRGDARKTCHTASTGANRSSTTSAYILSNITYEVLLALHTVSEVQWNPQPHKLQCWICLDGDCESWSGAAAGWSGCTRWQEDGKDKKSSKNKKTEGCCWIGGVTTLHSVMFFMNLLQVLRLDWMQAGVFRSKTKCTRV